eukprot:CAMPEP_0117885342 /NCGR_PEP_ID=MMETSP0950-20121206/19574_1 /TAXON_ID=44440 /ORGANISM="Chattonella subsalsa, Strain CCMP2191" /LENGTH=60 /DNA_ID=CAMNT_0005742193 /DNA_START=218 /DNA_END=397 /DNA_ORIENTATION=+
MKDAARISNVKEEPNKIINPLELMSPEKISTTEGAPQCANSTHTQINLDNILFWSNDTMQ